MATVVIIGLNGNLAFADAGDTLITRIGSQGGVQFDVIDPDGIKSVKMIGPVGPGFDCVGLDEEITFNSECPTSATNVGDFCPSPDQLAVGTIEITDCQPDMSTSRWEVDRVERTALCIDNCGPPAPCNVLAAPAPLDQLLADPQNCIQVDDKFFRDFRNYDGGNPFFDPNNIRVVGTIVNGEKGLQFNLNGFNTRTGDPDVDIDFDYDVISQGTPIIDNTLTLDAWGVNDPQQSPFTGVFVSEFVFSDAGHSKSDLITNKGVFESGDGNMVISEHKDFDPHQFVSISLHVDVLADPTLTGAVAIVAINQFTQTFSQEEPSDDGQVPVGGEIIPIETTSLILAGAQSFSWMIPLVLSILGIGLFVVSRKSNE